MYLNDIKANASQPHTLSSPTSQRSIQSLPKSVSAPTHGQTEKIKHGHTTLCISNSGFSAILKSKTINQSSVLSDSLVG